MNEVRPTWDEYFLAIAKTVSLRADCRRRKVGSVIVLQNRILSAGYNGAPSGDLGCLDGGCPRGLMSYEEVVASSAYDNCTAIHAEANALLYARTSLVGATIYITSAPCNDCKKLIAGAGIIRIIYSEE